MNLSEDPIGAFIIFFSGTISVFVILWWASGRKGHK